MLTDNMRMVYNNIDLVNFLAAENMLKMKLKRGIRLNKNIVCKILDYWYMMDVLNQNEHPYEDVKNYTALKQKAERSYKPVQPENFIDIAFTVTAEQLRGDVIVKLVNDELLRLNRLKSKFFKEQETETKQYNIYGAVTVYLGEALRENCLVQLAELLNSDTDIEARPEKMDSRLSLALLQIDVNGDYIPQSLSVSPVLWSLSVLKKSKIKAASSLTSKDYIDTINALDKTFTEKLLNIGKIWTTLEESFDYCRLAADRDNSQEFIVKFSVVYNSKNTDAVTDSPRLSMSFFADDLAHCRQMAENGKLTDKTANYITSPCSLVVSPFACIDLVTGEPEKLYSQFDKILDVKNTPIGKWPSEFFPALMQQAAINLETDRENVGSIFSVNGPPGTGKTTLLKEIIVNNIVERAKMIYEFTGKVSDNDPDTLFESVPFKHGDVKFGGKCGYAVFSYEWYRLKKQYDELNDYGIIVSSCNNAAVENISKELPVDEFTSYREKPEDKKDFDYEANTTLFSPVHNSEQMNMFTVTLDNGRLPSEFNNFKNKKTGMHRDVYFSYYADTLLNGENSAAQRLEGYADSINPKISHAWGLIAAPLGKRTNIKRFHESVLQPLVKSMQVFGKDKKSECHTHRVKTFRDARSKFKEQLDIVLTLQNELEIMQNKERSMHEAEKLMAEAKVKLQQTDYISLIRQYEEKAEEYRKKLSAYGDADRIKEQKLLQQSELLKLKKELADTAAEQRQHENEGRKKSLFCFGKKRAEEHLMHAEECKKRCDELGVIAAETQKLLTELESIFSLKEQYEITMEQVQKLKDEYYKLKNLSETKINGWKGERVNAVNSAFIADYLDKESECSTIANTAEMRVDKEYDRQRERLFYCALQLNKHFVFASDCLLENYKLLGQYWGFDKVQKVQKGPYVKPCFHKDDVLTFAPALYQSLLLLVPVISSTFASIGSMFRDVKEQDVIGTLIVDEAGQATPECAVGALFRCRRAMIVGDPKQVEPVVTDDLKLLRDSYEDEELQSYKNPSISVQTFADSLNPYGTMLSDIDDEGNRIDTWVGCPLVVHRRCISPMFDISNELSYKIMKNQTKMPDDKEVKEYIYPKSRWLDIEGSEAGNKNHYVKEQGEAIARLIIESFRKSSKTPSIYVISPFTSVVRGMKNAINAMAKEESIEIQDSIEQWSKNCIGTVHKFQGKEAKEVFFLLGCDKTSLSAVKWVNKNIVNVAATRAKHRLYIVGCYKGVWCNNPNLTTAYMLINEENL